MLDTRIAMLPTTIAMKQVARIKWMMQKSASTSLRGVMVPPTRIETAFQYTNRYMLRFKLCSSIGKGASMDKEFRTENSIFVVPSDLLELFNGYVIEQYPMPTKRLMNGLVKK